MNEALPLVSLVIPTFNQAGYLAQAIDSALAQTYQPLELIVIDDGSTDDTASVLRHYAGRLTTSRQDNMGQAATLNKGWSMARGSILGYLSSDDLLEPQAIEQSVAALSADARAVASYCDFVLIDDAGRAVRTCRTEPFSSRRIIEDLVCLPGPGALFRRSAFEQCGGWNPRYRQVPDFDFWLRMQRLGPFVRIPTSLARYRIHESSASLRPVPPSRSDEILEAVASYWQCNGSADGSMREASVSMSLLLSARSHFSAGRVGTGVARVARAWALCPRRIGEALGWRLLAGGLLRRPYYFARRRLLKSERP